MRLLFLLAAATAVLAQPVITPNGIVNAIIDLPKGTTFRPFDPERPDLLPKLRGIDFAPYKRFLAGQS